MNNLSSPFDYDGRLCRDVGLHDDQYPMENVLPFPTPPNSNDRSLHQDLSPRTKVLVSIAFHYSPARFDFLFQVVDNLITYHMDMTIFVETNSQDAKKPILDRYGHHNVYVDVHSSLKHPFDLTSQHRQRFYNALMDYDYFYYTEDDMLLPFANFCEYIRNFDALYLQNCIPSFARVEELHGRLYNTDNIVIHRSPSILRTIDDQLFAQLYSSYHAFWILPQCALRESVLNHGKDTFLYRHKHKCKHSYKQRECAASYPSCTLGLVGLVALSESKKVKDTCYAYHLPNNYATNRGSKFGSILMDDLIRL